MDVAAMAAFLSPFLPALIVSCRAPPQTATVTRAVGTLAAGSGA